MSKGIGKKLRIIIVVIFFIILGITAFILLLPCSRFYVGCKLKGTIRVTVNGESVIPTNIICTNENGEVEKGKVIQKDDIVKVKNRAFLYNRYKLEFDVDTEDGVKHIIFYVFKSHNGGPVVEFQYQISLKMKDNEWVAEVLLVRKDDMGQVQRISLNDDENAIVQLGP